MFDFFIALFGSLFYGKKIASENSKVKAFERNTKEQTELNNSIRAKIEASSELSQATKDRLLKGKCVNEIYNELKDDFKFVYGENVDIEKELRLPSNYKLTEKSIFDSPNKKYYWAYNLLLSHQGKVDWRVYSYGFQLGGTNTLEIDIKFCQRIEQNLNGNNVGIKLYLKPQYSTLSETYDWSPCAKTMVFEHQLFEGNGKRLW